MLSNQLEVYTIMTANLSQSFDNNKKKQPTIEFHIPLNESFTLQLFPLKQTMPVKALRHAGTMEEVNEITLPLWDHVKSTGKNNRNQRAVN